MGEVDFSTEMFSVLAEGEESPSEANEAHPFPLWDVLKEIDRRMRRGERDKGPGTREYLRTHPEELERVKKKYGL